MFDQLSEWYFRGLFAITELSNPLRGLSVIRACIWSVSNPVLIPTDYGAMYSKRQKLISKKIRMMEKTMDDYDHRKFVNMGASEKSTLISKNRSFIKGKGFNHLEHFFRMTIRVEGPFPGP